MENLIFKKELIRELFRLIIPAHPYKNVFSTVSSRMTSLGPVMVASSVNKAFWDLDVEIIDENNYRGPVGKDNLPDHVFMQQQRPAKYVGFYCGLTSTMPRVYRLAEFYSKVAIIIAGGDHVTHLPEEALENGVEIVVRGEGELAVIEIIRAIRENRGLEKVAGICWKKNGKIIYNEPEKLEIKDLNILPKPDFGLVRWPKKLSIYPISRTRGCSMRCEFCTVRSKPRWLDPARMFDDISWLVQTRKAKYFFITDDRLNEDQAGTERFFEIIMRAKKGNKLPKKIRFAVQIRLEAAREPEFLNLMKQAGVSTLCIGYESPIEEELKAMKKRLNPDEMIEYTKIFKRYGFSVHCMMMFAYPVSQGKIGLSAKERMKKFKKFIAQARPDTLQVVLTTPLPGTELYERIDKQGRIFSRQAVGWENYDGSRVCFKPDAPMSTDEVQQCLFKLMRDFYSSWNFWRIPLHIFSFPLVVPVWSFSVWKRGWLNALLGYKGYRIVKKRIKQEELK